MDLKLIKLFWNTRRSEWQFLLWRLLRWSGQAINTQCGIGWAGVRVRAKWLGSVNNSSRNKHLSSYFITSRVASALNALFQCTPLMAYVFQEIILSGTQVRHWITQSFCFNSLLSFLITSGRKLQFEVAIFNSILIHANLYFNKERAASGIEPSARNSI